MSPMACAVLTALVIAPAPEPTATGFSPGIGFTVAQLQRQADAEPAEDEEATATAPTSLVPILPPPPPSDLARVQGSPRARGIMAAAALATQVAMIVAGVAAVQQQRAQLRRERRGRTPAYRPYR